MHSPSSSSLLVVLLGLLAARGLQPDALDPWDAWVTFKDFARQVAVEPDHGVSVQVNPAGDRLPVHLCFTQQVLVPEGDRLEPAGAVIVEFVFAPRRRTPLAWHAWSFDHPTFEEFVDAVERNALVADLLVTKPLSSALYWLEA